MRLLCFAIPEKGHLNPLLPTLRRLVEAGHQLTLAAARDLSPVLAAAGIHARAVVLEAPAPPASFLTSGQAFAERLRDADWLARWIEALLIDAVPEQLPGVAALLAREQPDVVIADPMLYAVAIACAEANVPWAALSSSLNPVTPRAFRTALTDTLDRLHERRAALFHARGLAVPRFFVSDVESPWLNVAFTARAYCVEEPDPAVALAGAPFAERDRETRGDQPPFPWERLKKRPRLYASFGSQAFYQPLLFKRLFTASEALGMQLVASVGDLMDDADFVALAPPDALLVRYAPQLALLREVDLMVSHGGANSVVEALASGVPLLLLTLCNDQPLQARFLVASGAGQALDAAHGDVSPEALQAALTSLRDGPARERARHLATALAEAGGPDRAAALITALGARRAPMEAAHG